MLVSASLHLLKLYFGSIPWTQRLVLVSTSLHPLNWYSWHFLNWKTGASIFFNTSAGLVRFWNFLEIMTARKKKKNSILSWPLWDSNISKEIINHNSQTPVPHQLRVYYITKYLWKFVFCSYSPNRRIRTKCGPIL